MWCGWGSRSAASTFAEAGIATGDSLSYSAASCRRPTKHLNYKKGDFPVTERVAAEIVSLPMFPQLTHNQQDEVVKYVKEFANSTRQSVANATPSAPCRFTGRIQLC